LQDDAGAWAKGDCDLVPGRPRVGGLGPPRVRDDPAINAEHEMGSPLGSAENLQLEGLSPQSVGCAAYDIERKSPVFVSLPDDIRAAARNYQELICLALPRPDAGHAHPPSARR